MPYTDSQTFRDESASHKAVVEGRGYSVLNQICLDSYLIRNAPWKTYWHASKPDLGDVFIKINYGYEAGINELYGVKEALLPSYFEQYCAGLAGVKFPTVLESWRQDDVYVVVYEYVEFQQIPIATLVGDNRYHDRLLQFLETWSEIPAPDWWGSEYVLNNFALQPSPIRIEESCAPFGFDLGDNLGIDQAGNIYIYDFEFIQWVAPGLQIAYLNFFLLASWRSWLRLVSPKSFEREMYRRALSTNRAAIQQGHAIFSARHVRDNSWRVKTRVYAGLARTLQVLGVQAWLSREWVDE